MPVSTWDNLRLHLYLVGRHTQAYMLKYWPAETAATLAADSAVYSYLHG